MRKLTHSVLLKHVHYCPETGKFYKTLLVDRWMNETPILKEIGNIDKTGYVIVNIFGVVYKCHRLAFYYMTGDWPENHVDHVNGVRSDNRWCNLRDVTRSVNMMNRRTGKNNTSGHMGITWFHDTSQWRVRININGKRFSLGLYDTLHDAIAVRKGAERLIGYHENHGRFTK